ncbi:restriction endonuclease subunit S [Polaromonas sp.]|uniref:restriction endonuclease subunit S n=1 Tax=Polaromonas sp. TaxID=1869339 RepID=UPI002FC66DA7
MSLPRYEKYKESGVEWLGEIPSHWEVKRLKYNLGLLTEKTSRRENAVALENIEGWTGRFLSTETEFEGEGVAFESGDILFGKLRPYLAKAYLTEAAGEAVGDFHVMRPTANVAGRFAQYQLLSREFIAIVDGSTFGSKMPRASWEFVAGMILSTPPKAEQQTIAAFLDRETAKIDGLIAEQRRLVNLLKEKRQAVISHAVTKGLNPDAPMKDSGVAWLGEVPAHWEVSSLKRYWSIADCKHITAEFLDEGIPLASIREVQSRYVELENAKQTTDYFYEQLIEGGRLPKVGDLIFSRNATVGEVAQVADWHPRFAMGQDVCLLRKLEPNYSSDYMQLVLRSPVIVEQLEHVMVGSTFKRVNVEEIRGFVVPMPPAIEQSEIATFLDHQTTQLDTLTQEAQTAITLLQERRSALISAAVTGKIDVRGALPA